MQTSAKVSNLNQVIWDSNPNFWINLILIHNILMSAGLFPKRGFIISISHFTECCENQMVTVWKRLINLKSPIHSGAESGKVIQILYPGPDHQHFWSWIWVIYYFLDLKKYSVLLSARPNHNIKFQWNRLITRTFAIILTQTECQTNRSDCITSTFVQIIKITASKNHLAGRCSVQSP